MCCLPNQISQHLMNVKFSLQTNYSGTSKAILENPPRAALADLLPENNDEIRMCKGKTQKSLPT